MTRGRPLGVAAVIVIAAAAGGLAGAGVWQPRSGAPRAPSSPRAAGFLAGEVGYTLPDGWLVQDLLDGDDRPGEGVAAFIPCAPLDGTPHSANANLLAEPNAEGEDVASWSARRLAVAAPRSVVDDRVEGAWRTVVSEGVDRGARYVVVERFGATPRARLHAVAAFPSLAEVGEGWLARTGAEVDRFLDSLALAGAPPSAVHVAWERGALRLAASP